MSNPPPPAWQPPPPRAALPRREHSGHEHGRLALLIALSIALVSVLGAVVGWRAELHAAKASRYEQDAVAATISAAQLRSEAEAAAAKAYSQFEHFQRLGHEADELTPNACSGDNRNTIVDLDAGVLCSTQIQFGGYGGAGYVDAQGHFNVEKYAEDVQAGNATQNDIEPDSYEQQAEQERHHEDNMLYLSLFLALALALLTLGRLGKTTANRLVLAIPGWLCLIGGVVVLVMAEA
jgi:hypothetical protein